MALTLLRYMGVDDSPKIVVTWVVQGGATKARRYSATCTVGEFLNGDPRRFGDPLQIDFANLDMLQKVLVNSALLKRGYRRLAANGFQYSFSGVGPDNLVRRNAPCVVSGLPAEIVALIASFVTWQVSTVATLVQNGLCDFWVCVATSALSLGHAATPTAMAHSFGRAVDLGEVAEVLCMPYRIADTLVCGNSVLSTLLSEHGLESVCVALLGTDPVEQALAAWFQGHELGWFSATGLSPGDSPRGELNRSFPCRLWVSFEPPWFAGDDVVHPQAIRYNSLRSTGASIIRSRISDKRALVAAFGCEVLDAEGYAPTRPRRSTRSRAERAYRGSAGAAPSVSVLWRDLWRGYGAWSRWFNRQVPLYRTCQITPRANATCFWHALFLVLPHDKRGQVPDFDQSLPVTLQAAHAITLRLQLQLYVADEEEGVVQVHEAWPLGPGLALVRPARGEAHYLPTLGMHQGVHSEPVVEDAVVPTADPTPDVPAADDSLERFCDSAVLVLANVASALLLEHGGVLESAARETWAARESETLLAGYGILAEDALATHDLYCSGLWQSILEEARQNALTHRRWLRSWMRYDLHRDECIHEHLGGSCDRCALAEAALAGGDYEHYGAVCLDPQRPVLTFRHTHPALPQGVVRTDESWLCILSQPGRPDVELDVRPPTHVGRVWLRGGARSSILSAIGVRDHTPVPLGHFRLKGPRCTWSRAHEWNLLCQPADLQLQSRPVNTRLDRLLKDDGVMCFELEAMDTILADTRDIRPGPRQVLISRLPSDEDSEAECRLPLHWYAVGRTAPPILAPDGVWFRGPGPHLCGGCSTAVVVDTFDQGGLQSLRIVPRLGRKMLGGALQRIGQTCGVCYELREEVLLGADIESVTTFYVRADPIDPADPRRLLGGAINPGNLGLLCCGDRSLKISYFGYSVHEGHAYELFKPVLGAQRWIAKLKCFQPLVLGKVTGFAYKDIGLVKTASVDGMPGPCLDAQYKIAYSLMATRLPKPLVGIYRNMANYEFGEAARTGCDPVTLARELVAIDMAATATYGADMPFEV